ncbi:MAG: dockerin type I domain-containing protein [Thermoguttaceae bacterium]
MGSSAQGLVLSGGGADIQAGSIVLGYTGADPVTTVRSDLQSGLIHSTTAPSYCMIGYDDNNSTGNGVANGVMLEIALAGDTNLDGVVNGKDLATVLADWGKTGQVWAQGDVNYDGVVNGKDLATVLANWGKTMPAGYNSPLGGLAGAAGPCSVVSEPHPAPAPAPRPAPSPIQGPVAFVSGGASPTPLTSAETGGAAVAKTAVAPLTVATTPPGTPNSSATETARAAAIGRADLLAAVMREMDGRYDDSTSDDLLDAMLS